MGPLPEISTTEQSFWDDGATPEIWTIVGAAPKKLNDGAAPTKSNDGAAPRNLDNGAAHDKLKRRGCTRLAAARQKHHKSCRVRLGTLRNDLLI